MTRTVVKWVDDFLNTITMYRLVVYGLGLIAGIALLMAQLGRLSFSPTSMIMSAGVILLACYVTNRLFAELWEIPTNSESWLITGLILFLILQPATHLYQYMALFLAGAISSASKFVVAWRGKHIFNPAALAAAVMSLTALTSTSWWVGSAALWPFTLAIGLLIVRKIKRFSLMATFVAAAIALQIVVDILGGHSLTQDLKTALISSPLIFLATIMLTEPATMPPRKNQQILFAGLVALLYVPSWHLGSFYIYPEVALLLGNIYAFMVSPKLRLRLQLKEVQKVSSRVYNYVFEPDRRMKFLPGQYMEWTLANVPYDSRGNRRSFTIASSPTEADIQVGLKYYEPSSAYKSTFSQLRPGDVIYASQLMGNFTLNGNESKKLAFIAGGIGITPFRSMIKYLTDMGATFDIVLFYLVTDPEELAYEAEFYAAQKQGLRFVPISNIAGPRGNTHVVHFDEKIVAQALPDYHERIFYISGPNAMVESTRELLEHLSVPPTNVKTDHFSGY